MRKAIMISIQPQYVSKILNGEKTIEIRKSMPKCKLPIDVYIYCTKQGGYLTKERVKECYFDDNGHIEYMVTPKRNPFYRNSNLDIEMEEDVKQRSLNSKVVAKFTLKEIGLVDPDYNYLGPSCEGSWGYILDKCCLSRKQLNEYGKGKWLYSWYIDNLEVFDVPKELSEFKIAQRTLEFDGRRDETYYSNELKNMIKAPQSWCYCYKEENK